MPSTEASRNRSRPTAFRHRALRCLRKHLPLCSKRNAQTVWGMSLDARLDAWCRGAGDPASNNAGADRSAVRHQESRALLRPNHSSSSCHDRGSSRDHHSRNARTRWARAQRRSGPGAGDRHHCPILALFNREPRTNDLRLITDYSPCITRCHGEFSVLGGGSLALGHRSYALTDTGFGHRLTGATATPTLESALP